MPVYPAVKTYWGGFYNNEKVNGADDRVYSAADLRKPYDAVFTDGVKPSEDGTAGNNLRVSLVSGMTISVSAGHAKLGGAWFENKSNYNITLDGATTTNRYDCVIIRNDDSDAVREPSIYIKSLDTVPTASDLERNDTVYEICVAYVKILPFAASISNGDIVDTREDGELCNVMRGVGAVVATTIENTYYTTSANQTVIPIGIPQFVRGRDSIVVMVEGRVFTQGTDYQIKDNESITLTIGLPVLGTKVQFQVVKNVNASGAETIVHEVLAMRAELNSVNNQIANYPFNRTYISTKKPTAADGRDGDVWFVVE